MAQRLDWPYCGSPTLFFGCDNGYFANNGRKYWPV